MLLLASAVLSLAPGGVAPPAPDPGEGDLTLTSRTIWSYYTETPPSMDDPLDSVWDYPLEVLGLIPGHVALSGGTSLEIRSVYTDNDVYFRIMWHDVVENSGAPKWVFHDGNWTFTAPFEDGLGLYFPITDPESKFLEDGCMVTCHMTDWENPQNQERKFTYNEEETGDLWFWSAGLSNPWDFAIDAYVNDKPSANNVGYYEDPEMGLNLIKNRHLTEYMEYVYMSRPVYMQDPNMNPSYGPHFIAKGEEMVFDQSYYDPNLGDPGLNPITHEPWQNGDMVAGYVLDRLPEKGLGQIDARASYDVQEQQWSLVLSRPLDTGDPIHDVIFDDLAATYQFGISLFGDIMGGGDASEPFVEPDPGGGDRCVMNKVTNTIGLRFRPVLQAERVEPGAPDSWDAAGWDQGSTHILHELIHRSGEIHDPWDWMKLSAACDGERVYVHIRHGDPNTSEEYSVELVWLQPGMVSVEETFHLLDWSDIIGHMSTEEGVADLWRWDRNSSTPPEGVAKDMAVVDGTAYEDASGATDLVARTWREDGERHIVLSRSLDTGEAGDDVIFNDMARTYVLRLAIYTSDRDEWLVSLPVSAGFRPDPDDDTPIGGLTGVTVADGGDSNLSIAWDTSSADDFGQYRVYIGTEEYDDLDGMSPIARISDMEVGDLRLRGVRPDTTYHVAVVAMDDNRNLPTTVTTHQVTVTDDTPPLALENITVFDNLDSDLLITWDPGDSPDIEGYEVYLEATPFSDASGLEPTAYVRGMRTGSYRVGGLEAGTTYHAAAVAVDWSGNADRHVTSVTGSPTDVTAPPEVRGIDGSTPQAPDSEGEVLLKWRETAAEDVSRYNVYMSLTPIASLQNFAPWDIIPAGQTSQVVTGLNPGVTYYFAVTAVDGNGHEGPSKFTVNAIASTAEPPETVVGLAAVQVGEGSARLSWPPVNVTGAPVVNYRVYMSPEPIGTVDDEGVMWIANVTPTGEPDYLATGLEQGATYYFTVVSEDGRGRISEGAPQVASVTIPVVKVEGPSLWDEFGPWITGVLAIAVLVLLAYVGISRQRKYGRLLSRRPAWERGNNGGRQI
jgi:hypothetical protein